MDRKQMKERIKVRKKFKNLSMWDRWEKRHYYEGIEIVMM